MCACVRVYVREMMLVYSAIHCFMLQLCVLLCSEYVLQYCQLCDEVP